MSKQTKTLVLEMFVGVSVFGLLLSALVLLFCFKTGWPMKPALLGVLVGILANFAMLVHMAVITERVLESKNEAYANKTTLIHSMLRKLVFIVLIFVVWRLPAVEVMTMILGAFGLKAGAYLQPLVHKALCRDSAA